MTTEIEPTEEQKAAAAQKAQADLLAKCAEERRLAKEKMLARNAARIEYLTFHGLLKKDETLEQYDTRTAQQ